MNKDVKVENMQVKSKAEGGLLISEVKEVSGVWDDEANTTAEVSEALVGLYPTSSANSVNWYHATSKAANSAASASQGATNALLTAYEPLTLTASTLTAAASGANALKEVYYSDTDGTTGYNKDSDAQYYIKYTYYMKASNETGLTGLGTASGKQNVVISKVTATRDDDETSSELDKSFRVGVVIGGKFYGFAQ